MIDFVQELVKKILIIIFNFAGVKVVDFKGKPKLKSLKNEFIRELNRSSYKRNDKSFCNNFEYTGYNLDYGLKSPIKEFLSYIKNVGYLKNSKAWGERTKNETFSDLNEFYPEVYEKNMKLFERDGFNLDDLDKIFN